MGVRVVFPDMGKDPSIQLIEKTITENGTYDAITDGANGYSKVNVNVEGGGGSSDFSTAEVTFVCSAGDYSVSLSAIENGNLIVGMTNRIYDDKPHAFTIPLLNGQAILDISALYDIDTEVAPTLAGSIELTQDGLVITGDGTITAKGQ